MARSLNSLTLRLSFRPSFLAKEKNVVITISMAASSSVSGSAAIRAPGLERTPHRAELQEEEAERESQG